MNIDILWICENSAGGFNARFNKKKTSFDTLRDVFRYAKVRKLIVIYE